MGNYDVMRWCSDTVAKIRQHSQRPIRLRAHPGDKGAATYLNPDNPAYLLRGIAGVSVSPPGRSLIDDLRDCWCVVNHNSSPAVGAAIEGIPVFVTDAVRSQAQDVANTDLGQIENPRMPDRTAWLHRLAQFHWNFQDVASGRAWRHMKQWIKR